MVHAVFGEEKFTRLDAVLCCDETGRYIASIEIPQLVEVLAEGFTEPA